MPLTSVATSAEPVAGPVKKRAPTLYAIIAFKLLKGSLFLALAVMVFTLSDNDLPSEYQKFLSKHPQILQHLRYNPERKFWTDLAHGIDNLTEGNMRWTALGTLVYSLFSLVEGVGLLFRISWAGWLTIGESAFFIPIEIFELTHRVSTKTPGKSSHPIFILIILLFNIWIVWYLIKNKERLFKHHHH